MTSPFNSWSWCVLLAAAWLAAAPARGDYQSSFVKGITAMDQGNWTEAVRWLSAAAQENPKEGGRVLIYGMRYKAYLPHYYLGVAYRNAGNCDSARREWAESQRQGAIQQASEFKELQRLLPQCEELAARAGPANLPAPSPTASTKELLIAQNPPRRSEAEAEAAPQPAPPSQSRPSPQPPSVAPTAAARVPTRTPPKAASPPDALLAAAAAYFHGDYAAAVKRLTEARFPNPRAAAQARLFRAAASYGLFVMGGEKEQALRDQAARDVRACKGLDPNLRLSAKAFSPRFADFFARS